MSLRALTLVPAIAALSGCPGSTGEASRPDAAQGNASVDASDASARDAAEVIDGAPGADAPDAIGMTDASATDGSDATRDGGRCPPGTCFPPGREVCEPPGGPLGNACCACDGDLCSSPCRCAAPDTLIATPGGERPIASLSVGDLVYSMDRGELLAVPLLAVQRVPVKGHRVMRVVLGSGAVLRISAAHPTADGRTFGALREGDLLDGHRITSAKVIDYPFDETWDILPGSDTGTYVAGGALIGTTIPRSRTRSPSVLEGASCLEL